MKQIVSSMEELSIVELTQLVRGKEFFYSVETFQLGKLIGGS